MSLRGEDEPSWRLNCPVESLFLSCMVGLLCLESSLFDGLTDAGRVLSSFEIDWRLRASWSSVLSKYSPGTS